jgi:hypothetical protein
MKKLLAALILVYPALAWAQAPVKQSGTVTPGHATSWTTNGVVQDAGTAANGKLSSLGITASGPSFCINSAAITSAGWQQFCFGVTTANGGAISVQNFGTALAKPFTVTVNGTPYQFPFSLSGILGPITSTSGDIAVWNNSIGTLLSDATGFNISPGGPFSINPTPSSLNQGVVVTQTGSATAPTGPLSYNLITVTNPASVTLPNTLTNGMGNFEARGFDVQMNDSSTTTVAMAGAFHMVVNSGSPAGDKVAIVGNAYTSKSINGFLLGIDAVASVDTGGSTPDLVALQTETAFLGTGTATNRYGIEVTNDTSRQATNFDAAIVIDNVGTVAGAYFNGISFGSPVNLASAIDPAGNALTVQQALTVANFCNCSNFTMTGSIPVNFGNTFNITNLNNQNGQTQINLTNNNAGASALVEYVAGNGTNNATFGIGGTGLTGAYQGRGFLTSNGTAPLIVGTSGNAPMQIFTNNVEVARVAVSGGLSVGTTADPGAGTAILKKQAFASLTACSSTIEGAIASVTDSSTVTWGATITGSSTNHVMAYCDGTNWTVAGK